MVYTCLPDGKADKSSLKVQLYSRTKTMRQVCADVKSSLNLTARVDTRLSLKKLEAEMGPGGTTELGLFRRRHKITPPLPRALRADHVLAVTGCCVLLSVCYLVLCAVGRVERPRGLLVLPGRGRRCQDRFCIQ